MKPIKIMRGDYNWDQIEEERKILIVIEET